MKSLISLPLFFITPLLLMAQPQEALVDPKGAIIIAQLQGEISVTNNNTGLVLPSGTVKAGGILSDGHTIRTGANAKIVLLLSNGTVTTLKAESSLNFKKFTQEKFDTSKIKLTELKGEPSKSNVVIDIEFGDLVVDVKKLDKQSNFNIESPVGTAGIRGTVPAISVVKNPNGGFSQTTSMLRGEIAFTPKGGGLPTLLGPGQSLSTGIGPNGIVLPLQMGRVSAALLNSIQADVDAQGAAMGMIYEPKSNDSKRRSGKTETGDEDAPSEDELNDSDDSRKGASKGVGGDDDNGTQQAVALDKAGLIDLDNSEQVAKVETYVEVTEKASELYADKKEADATAARRRANNGESTADESGSFLTNLVGNLDDVVDITETANDLGAKDADVLNEVVDNADKAKDIKVVFQAAEEIGSKDTGTVGAVLRNASNADKVAEVVRSTDIDDVAAKRRANSPSEDKSKKLGGMFKAIKKVDEVAQKKKAAAAEAAAAEASAAEAAAAAAAVAAAAEAAAEAAAAQELAAAEAEQRQLQQAAAELAAQLVNASDEEKIALQAQKDAADKAATDAAQAAADKAAADALAKAAAADQAAQEVASAKVAYDNAVITIETASSKEKVDQIVSDYENSHSLLSRSGLNLTGKALVRKNDIETPVVDVGNVFTNLAAVADLTATATDLEETIKAQAQASGKSDDVIAAEISAVSAGFNSVLQNADQANELNEMVGKAQGISAGSGGPSVSNLLNNASKAKDLKTVVDSAETTGANDSLTALLKNPDKADKFAAVVNEQATSNEPSNLNTLFDVVKKVDAAKDAQIVAAAEQAAAEAETTRLNEKATLIADQLENASAEEKAALEVQAAAARATADEAKRVADAKADATLKANAIKVDDAFNQISDVVELAKSATELARGNEDSSFLDNVLQNAEQAAELNDLIKKADEIAAAEKKAAEDAIATANAIVDVDARAAALAEAEAAAAAAKVAKNSRSNKLFSNASQAADLKAMVDKNDELATAAREAANLLDGDAKDAALLEAKAAEAARANKLLENADKAKDMKLLAEKAEAAEAAARAEAAAAKAAADQEKERLAAEALALADQLANADEAARAGLEAQKAAADEAARQAEEAADAAAAAELAQQTAASSLGSLFDNAENASDVAAVVAAAELEKERLAAEALDLAGQLANANEGERVALKAQKDAADAAAAKAEAEALSSVGAVIANADQAKAMKAAVDAATSSTGDDSGDKSGQKLKTLFAVVKKVDDSKKVPPSNAGADSTPTSQSNSAFENLQALVDVAEALSDSDGSDADIDLGAGFDAVLQSAETAGQLASALKEDASLIATINQASASNDGSAPVLDLEAEVAKSALGKLENRFADNSELLASINQYEDRADDLAYVLNSDAVKGNPELEANFLNNLDNLDNLLDLTSVLEDDSAKIQAVFQNLDKAEDLKVLTEQFRYEPEKLDAVYGQMDKLENFKSLSNTYTDEPDKLDLIFSNTDKLDGIITLSSTLASNEMEIVFDNLEYIPEIQTITSRYEGDEQTVVLESLDSLARRFEDDPEKREIVFNNPDKLTALQTLTSDLDDEAGFDVVFDNIDKSDAILNTYNDIKELPEDQQAEYLANLFKDQDSFESTMKEQGKLMLNLDFPQYGDEIEQYGDRAAEIAITAELFSDNPDDLDILFGNLDSLDIIREADTLGAKPVEILENIDNLKALKSDNDITPELEARYLAEPSQVRDLLDIKDEAKELGADVNDIFANFEDLKRLKADSDVSPELEAQFLRDPGSVGTILSVKDQAKALDADVNDVLNNIDDLVALTENFHGDTSKVDAVLKNPNKAEMLRDLTGKLDGKEDNLFENLDQLDVIADLASDFGNDLSKMDTVFANADKASQLRDLSDQLDGKSESLLANVDQLDVIADLATEFGNDLTKMDTVFANADKASQLRDLSDQLDGKSESLLANVDQLDVIADLATDFGNDLTKMDTVFANADKASQLRDLSDQLDGKSESLLANVAQLDVIADLATDFGNDPTKMDTIFANPEKAERVRNLNDKFSDKSDDILRGINDLSELEDLTSRFENDSSRLETLFDNVDKIVDVKTLADKFDEAAQQGIELSAEDVLTNIDKIDDIVELSEVYKNDDGKLMNVYLNPDKAKDLNDLVGRYSENADTLVDNLSALDDFLNLEKDFQGDASKMATVFANPDKADDLKRLNDQFSDQGDTFLANLDKLEDFEELASDFGGDATKMATVFANPDKADDLKRLNDQFSDQGDTFLANLDKLEDFEELATDFGGDATKMATVFANPDKADDLKRLNDQFSDQGDTFLANLDKLEDFEELATDFGGDATKMATVFANPDKADDLKRLNDQFSDQGDTFLANLDKLEDFEELATDFGGDASKMATVFANPDKADDLKRLNDQFSDQGDTFLANLDKLEDFEELATDFGGDATKMATVFANPDKADELKRLNDQFSDQGDTFLANLDKLEDFEELATDFGGDATKMATVFANPEQADELKRLNELHPGKEDLFLGNLDSLDILEEDAAYIDLLESDQDFFDDIKNLDPEMKNLPPELLSELKKLNLTEEELAVVVNDLIQGPNASDPTSTAPNSDPSGQTNSLSLLQDHSFEGTISPQLIMSKELAFASDFFSEAADSYEGLSALDKDSGSDNNENPSASTQKVIGGRSLSFSTGTYQFDSGMIIASTDKLTLTGELVFGNTNQNELILISAGLIEMSEGTSVSYQSDELGFGSFESLNVVNVDLHAEGEISLRSLDNIVINNSDMRTSGNGGADFVHLLAASELTIDNLRFSEQVRQIAMEAMTINLQNINFPSGSTVKLNSQYGGIDGKYPNFGNKLYGRVNFINNVRYNSNLINSTSTFDQFGSSITIGALK